MKVTRLLCVVTALLLPVIAFAQTATQQPARQAKDATRDGTRAQDAKQQRSDANAPGKSENAPGQQKKSSTKAKSSDKKSTDKKSGDKKSKEKK
ncbi:MAG: hypothetical protein ACAH21_16490 [Ramlibacter sp.]|nr:hypothetical protein [Ramlibacter sp.]